MASSAGIPLSVLLIAAHPLLRPSMVQDKINLINKEIFSNNAEMLQVMHLAKPGIDKISSQFV